MRSRALKAYCRGGSAFGAQEDAALHAGGRGTPASASVVAVRSSRLMTWSLTRAGLAIAAAAGKFFGQRMISGTRRPLS